MTVLKYRKKPVVIEAVQLTLTSKAAIESFVGGQLTSNPMGELFINTLEGSMHVSFGDYVIKGVQGEFYPCKPDIFAATYEPESPDATS